MADEISDPHVDTSELGSNSASSTSISSGASLLYARISQLECELAQALLENQSLNFQLLQNGELLMDEREIRSELVKANKALTDEVEDLTKALFVEANDMVERESQARYILEVRQKKLESELQTTKEQLSAQTQQLSELRQKLMSSKSLITIDSSLCASENAQTPLLVFQYYDDLFPNQKFCQKKLNSLANFDVKTWDDIVQEIPDQIFERFSNFVELASLNGLDKMHSINRIVSSASQEVVLEPKKKKSDVLSTDEKVLNHEFMRSLYETDVEPCLRFNPFMSIKSHSFLRKLVMSMLSNTCCIEQLTISEVESIFHGLLVNSLPTSPSANGQIDTVHHKNVKKKTLKSLLMNLSVTSLPENVVNHATDSEEPEHPIGSAGKPSTPQCSLCKGFLKKSGPIYRFRLSERDSLGWFCIDAYCRGRLVAVGDFYTFVRHIRRGLHSHRSIADIYCELLHYLRNMFYSRLGACSFYIRNDAELLLSKFV